jgi:hypothetical protein
MSAIFRNLQAWAALHPFLLLTRHFSRRSVGSGSSSSDVDLGFGGALALLALPGAFTSLFLLNKYSSFLQWLRGNPRFNPYAVCISDEYFFIVYSMAITGLVTLARWEYLLPARRDFMNLAPLPLKLRDIFLANAVALGGVATVFAIDVNLVSSVFFPSFATMKVGSVKAFAAFFAAHISAVLGISAFTFTALLALQALMMSLLPEPAYRRASPVVRTALLVFFFSILLSAFVVPIPAANIGSASLSAANWWPPIWFLSLFESQIAEIPGKPMFGAHHALWAIVIAAGLAVLGFTLSYRRYFLRIPERREGPGNTSRIGRVQFGFFKKLSRLWLRPGMETACYGFLLKTLVRSETHLVFLGLWSGIGLLLALENSIGSLSQTSGTNALHAALLGPLVLAFAVIAGLRFVFDIPSTIEANWLFRLTAGDGTSAVRSACQKVMFTLILPWLVLLWLPFAARRWGWADATLITAMDLCLIIAGVRLVLFRFRKLPFTCSFRASRDHLLRMALSCLAVLLFVIPLLARLEERILTHPAQIAIFVMFSAAVVVLIRQEDHAALREPVFEDNGQPEFAQLHLSGD